MKRNSIYWILTALLAASASPGARQSPAELAQREVGAGVIAATSGSPLHFMDALRDEGIPAGLHLRSAKWLALRAEPRSSESRGAGTTTVEQAAAVFVASHPGWSVDVSSTGVIVRDVGLRPRGDSVPEFSVLNMEIRAAFNAAERAVDPTIPVLGGMVSSVISDPDEIPLPRPAPTLVTVHLVQATLEEILNAISSEHVGTGWVLVRDVSKGQTYDRLSVRYPGGRHSDSAWPLVVPPGQE